MIHLPRIYPILDTATVARHGALCIPVAAAMISGGAGILQYRHKGFWSGERFEEARAISQLCRDTGIPFVVNDRADYAAILCREGLATGLHVGQHDLNPADARKVIGMDAVLGFSTHHATQLIDAADERVDYIAFGPIFDTDSKANPDPTTGVSALRGIRGLTSLPLVAIGGITLENARGCLAAGADAVAVISALVPRPFSVEAVAEQMRRWQRLERSWVY